MAVTSKGYRMRRACVTCVLLIVVLAASASGCAMSGGQQAFPGRRAIPSLTLALLTHGALTLKLREFDTQVGMLSALYHTCADIPAVSQRRVTAIARITPKRLSSAFRARAVGGFRFTALVCLAIRRAIRAYLEGP